MMRSGRIFLCTVSMAWGALMNGGNAAEENPVKVGVGHVGWEPHLMWYSSGEEDLGDFKRNGFGVDNITHAECQGTVVLSGKCQWRKTGFRSP